MANTLDAAVIIAEVSYIVASNRALLSTAVLVSYEYLVTFSTEVQLFWGREVTGASILFFVNRYTRLVYVLYSLRMFFPSTDALPVCRPYVFSQESLALVDYIPWAGFSALRVFALTGGNWLIAPAVFVLSLGPVIINFVAMHWTIFENDPIAGCIDYVNISDTLSTELVIISRVSLIVADLIVIVVTWAATYKTVVASRDVIHSSRPTFSGLLLRDGTLSFLVMLSMNVLQVAFTSSPVLISLDNGGFSLITTLSEPLTSILISRFMMNLQEAKHVISGSVGESRSVSFVRFERVVGSIAQPLGLSVVQHAHDDASDSG